MNITEDGILFRSDRNFLKRDPSSGQQVMLGPNVSEYFGNLYTRTLVINHALGYVPFYRAFYEPFGDGKLMPATDDSDYYHSNPINTYGGGEDGPTLSAKMDNVNLTLTLKYLNNSRAAQNFPVYWVIYKDFGLEP